MSSEYDEGRTFEGSAKGRSDRASDLCAVFQRSFEEFLHREISNILRGTSERNLRACLAPLLERQALEAGFEGYRADVEYNRKQQGKVKTILDEQLCVVPITPDLILHSRGEFVENDNLIAIEMKRAAHRNDEKEKDRARLRALTKSSYDGVWSADGQAHPEHVCGYLVGFYVELDRKGRLFVIEEYRKGAQISRTTVGF